MTIAAPEDARSAVAAGRPAIAKTLGLGLGVRTFTMADRNRSSSTVVTMTSNYVVILTLGSMGKVKAPTSKSYGAF